MIILLVVLVLLGLLSFFLVKPLIFAKRIYMPMGMSIRVPRGWYYYINEDVEDQIKEPVKQLVFALSDKEPDKARYRPAHYWQENQSKGNIENLKAFITLGVSNMSLFGEDSALVEYEMYTQKGNFGKKVILEGKEAYFVDVAKNNVAREYDYNFDHNYLTYKIRAIFDYKNAGGGERSKLELTYYEFIAEQVVRSIRFE